MSDDLTIAYMLGVEDMRSKLHKQADEIERLQQLNEYLRSEKERLSKDVYNLILKKEEVKTENEKLREALKPFAYNYQNNGLSHSMFIFEMKDLLAAKKALESVNE